jgi:uncharacterized membrane protein (UPF0127 family)
MLFDFGRDQEVRMWMKDTPISLDMIFVASNGRIERIQRKTEPSSLHIIPSNGPIRMVIEVKAGTVDKFAISVGDRVVGPLTVKRGNGAEGQARHAPNCG